MHLKIFDVEHGACALLTCDNGARLMIDCGHNATNGWKPGDYLAGLGVQNLDMLAITNYDEDHASGLPNLLSKVYIDWMLRNPTVSPHALKLLKSDTGFGLGIESLTKIMDRFGPSQNSQPYFQGVSVRYFYNPYPFFDDENNLSMVVHLSMNNTGFLFPGDLETAGWRNMLATNAGFREVVKATHVLIAAHHGRDSGICTELFDYYGCSPQIVVISDDCHQHETQKTTAYYQSKCSSINGFRGQGSRWVLSTRCDGDITFNAGPQGCLVS